MARSPAAAWAVPAAIAAHLVLVVPLAVVLNVWVDEAYSLHTTSGSLGETLRLALSFERQAPGYFVLLRLWRCIDASPTFARLFSVLCTGLTILVVARLAKRLFPEAHPGWTAVVLAWHPVVVWAAVEIRVYALALLLAALLLWAFFEAFGPGERGGRKLAFVVVSALALYTQYYLGFLLAGLGLAVACWRGAREALRYGLAMGAVALLCLPIAAWLPEQSTGAGAAVAETLSGHEALRFWLHLMTEALLPGYELIFELRQMALERALVWGARMLLAGAAALALWRARPRRSVVAARGIFGLWLAFAAVALAFAALGSLVSEHLVDQDRYWSLLAVPGTLALLSLPAVAAHRGALAGTLALVLVTDAALLIHRYEPLAKEGDAARVAHFLMEREAPGQPILVFPNELVLPLRLYYAGANAMVPIAREPSLEVFDPRDTAIGSEVELRELVASLPAEADEIWLVKRRVRSYAGIPYRLDVLESFIEAHYTVRERGRFFDRVTVDRLIPREDSAPPDQNPLDGAASMPEPPG